MGLGEFTAGLLFLAGTWGASLGAAALATVRLFPRLGGAPRVLAFSVLATAALVVVHLVPGALGVLTREVVLAVALVLLLIVWRLVPQQVGGQKLDAPEPVADSGPLSWGIVAVTGAVLAVAVLAEVTLGIRTPAHDVDSLTFQLPNIGHWIQEKSFWSINQFVPLQAHGDYPNNGDLIFLSVMLPFDADVLIRLVDVPFYLLTCLSVYAIGRELRAPRSTAALLALGVGALPILHLAWFAGAKTDPIFYASFGAAVLFVLRALRTRERRELALAGVGLGLALGTKWYGVTVVPIVIAAWGIAEYVHARRPRPVLTGGGLLVGLAALLGGFWMLRNWIESGSPLFPQGVPLLARTPTDYTRECAGFSIADYASDPGILREYVWPAFRAQHGLGGAVLVVGWVGALVAAVRARRRPVSEMRAAGPAVWMMLGLVVALAAAYTITPYTALGLRDRPTTAGPNMRYLLPAMMCVAPLAAWWIGRLGRAPRLIAEVVAGIAVLDGVRRGFDVPARSWAAGLALLLAAAVATYILVRLRPRFPERRYAVAVGIVLALVVAGGLYNRQQAFMDHRYADAQPVIKRLMATPGGGQRIGIAGYYNPTHMPPMWPAFGSRLQNHVEYVGHFRDGQLNEFADARSWRRRVAERHYDVVAVGYGAYPAECRLPGSESDDNAFARAAGYRLVASSDYLNVYAVR